jgi:hypothetical protein
MIRIRKSGYEFVEMFRAAPQLVVSGEFFVGTRPRRLSA